MSQDNKQKARHIKSQMMKISLTALLIVVLFMIEMYEIITDPANMIVLGALGIFLLAAVYVEMLFIGKLAEIKALDQEEAFDNVYRSEKASYLLMRKYFDQMEKKMENLGDISNIPYKELIAAQKALAKAQINRNKQNTNALLISNDRMMQRLTSIQNDITDILTNTKENENTDINEINAGLSEQDKAVFLEGNKDVLEKQQEILHNLKELESSLRNEILESANKMASMQSQQISVPQPQMQIQENEDMIPPLDIEEEFSFADIPDEQERKQSYGNSSESNLDRLLQQMNIPDSIESDLQPIAEESELQPIIEEPELQPILETPELQPIMEEPELQPIIETSELQPVMEEPELQMFLETPELQPIAKESEMQAIAEEPELQPIIETSELQSIMEEPELQPIIETPEFRPEAEESELQQILETPELQPVIDESEVQSILEEPELQLTGTPDIQAVTEESELQQPIEGLGSITEPEFDLPPIGNMQESSIAVSEQMPMMQQQMEFETIAAEPEMQSLLIEPEMESIAAVAELEVEQPIAATESEIEQPIAATESVIEDQPGLATDAADSVLEWPGLESISIESEPVMEQAELQTAEEELEPVMMEQPELETTKVEPEIEQPEFVSTEQLLEPVTDDSVIDPAEEAKRQLQSIAEKFQPKTKSALEAYRTKSPLQSLKNETNRSMKIEAPQVPDKSNKATSDKLASMVASLEKDMQIEPELKPIAEELESGSIMAETSESVIQSDITASADEELEKIMKAMDIEDVSGDSLEDLDIDKILEVPLSDEKQAGTGSDQVMSSEEIAALIANTELLSEPETAKNDDLMDLSDPRHVMSSDEIAALIANM